MSTFTIVSFAAGFIVGNFINWFLKWIWNQIPSKPISPELVKLLKEL